DVVQARLWLAQAVAVVLLATATVHALVQSRHSQRSLTRLVIDLDNVTRPGQLRAALAQRLGDPQLVAAYPIDDDQRYVDAEAHDVDLTNLPPDRTQTSLAHDGSEIAVLQHRRGILDTPEAVGELLPARPPSARERTTARQSARPTGRSTLIR
ncbi:MAG TPA: hypothetical protein VFC19_26855, partial [Candidatus Limnocylindrales bacterium]|nr:hypothetical protein [Candidatus Limnocylindrales bacterium]